ncbi:hypothetical protein N431DRAFT_503803 [Stipitochalara longipes BDJ]|nr:hypothetical protein N431DRAFT_503803 [Stipitochalara longipes BDJ]
MPRIKGGGNSGGCRTCRRRKVKCDQRHPACERCEKGNRECEGYGRDNRFVDENSRTERRAKRKSTKVLNDSFILPSSGCVQVVRPWNSDASICKDLGLSAFEENFHISFLLANLLTGIPNSTPWLELHAEDPSPCAQMSIRALSAVYFGRVHHLDKTTAQGFEYYIDALRTLNHSLRHAKHATSITVIKSAIALELYEFIAFNSASGWLKHAGGVGKLIELRGPWIYQNIDERRLLEGNRVTIALECLIQKKRCFLEHPDWKTIPWATDPESKTLELCLHDLLCDVPGLLVDATNLQFSILEMDQKHSLYRDLSSKILVHLQSLYEWRATWQQQNPDCCCEVPTSYPDHEAFSSTVFYYSTLSTANEICSYNAQLLLILRLGSEVIGPTFDPALSSLHLPGYLNYDPLFPPGLAVNAQAVATEICKSVEYHLLHPASSAAAFFLLLPLRLAYQTFSPGSKESEWLSGVMRRIADSSGFEISRSLSGKEVVPTSS